jgi:hypothetical protein
VSTTLGIIPEKPVVNTVSDLEEILGSLCASEINASISWLWDGGIDLKLGDALNGYRAEGKVGTFGAAAEWLTTTRYVGGIALPARPGDWQLDNLNRRTPRKA